jgi:hypothetical protein
LLLLISTGSSHVILATSKSQIPISLPTGRQANPKQIQNSILQITKTSYSVLNLGHWKLFGIWDLVFGISSDISDLLMSEVSHPCKDHSDVVFIRCGNHLIIPDRTAWLDDGRGP